MKAVDTNILVRYYAQDDPAQSAIALRLMANEPSIFVPKTVMLELWWVLTQADKFHFPVNKIILVFEHLLGLPNVIAEDTSAISRALTWCRAGLEFQDALHLAASAHCDTMLTFDD